MAVDVGLLAIVVGAGLLGSVAWISKSIEIGLAACAVGVTYVGLVTEADLLYRSAWVIIVLAGIVFAFRLVKEVV